MIRESVRTVLQELVEFEATGVIGAKRYERTEDDLRPTQADPEAVSHAWDEVRDQLTTSFRSPGRRTSSTTDGQQSARMAW